jgi:RNA polymerase sigma-70 factor (ECF subfamily)
MRPVKPEDAHADGNLAPGADRWAQFLRHRHMLLDYLRCLLRNESDAEDVFQEVGLVVVKHAQGPQDAAHFGNWCRGIARNLVMHHLRGQARLRRRETDAFADLVDRVFDEADGESELWERRRLALRGCLEALSDGDREILRRRYESDDTAEGIGRWLRRSPEAVRMRIMRLRQTLERCVERKTGRMESVS